MKLAIVIPFYKSCFFEQTLHSLANQTNKNFRVYIGDDASPQDPLKILDRFQNEFTFSYKRFRNNVGSSSLTDHWKRCIDMIGKEEWIMLLGDDDILGKDVVDSWHKNYFDFSSKSNVVRFASQIVEEKTGKISEVYTHPTWESAPNFYYRKYNNITRSSLSEYTFSSNSYSKYGFRNYPLGWHSDDNAWFDFSDGKLIYTINEAIVSIRISDESISGRKDNMRQKNIASMKFYRFLIAQKLSLFKKEFRFVILRAYENSTLRVRKLKIEERLFLLFYYLKFFEFYEIKKFIRRMIS